MTDPQDMHLHAAIKRAMGSYYDNSKTCVYNVTKLVNKCDDLSEFIGTGEKDKKTGYLIFKTPSEFYEELINGQKTKLQSK